MIYCIDIGSIDSFSPSRVLFSSLSRNIVTSLVTRNRRKVEERLQPLPLLRSLNVMERGATPVKEGRVESSFISLTKEFLLR